MKSDLKLYIQKYFGSSIMSLRVRVFVERTSNTDSYPLFTKCLLSEDLILEPWSPLPPGPKDINLHWRKIEPTSSTSNSSTTLVNDQ